MRGARRALGRDSMASRIWRFRGLIAIFLPVFLLVLAIVLLMPSAPNEHLPFSHDQLSASGSGIPQRRAPVDTLDITVPVHADDFTEEVKIDGDGQNRFAIVFDAGSTGSRVHVFKFEVGARTELVLIDDTFEQLKPGLSSFAKEPAKGAASLKPLLATALETVPAAQRASTTVEVRATAGLRMLPGSEADDLLEAVRRLLDEYPFAFDKDSVSIMDGESEGAFQWLTMNYLLGNLAGGIEDTVATVDLGGGSVQLAYAAESAHAQNAPPGYFKEMKSGGNAYYVYVYSHLGYGLMAARAAVLGKAEGNASPCVPVGHDGEYVYGGKTHRAKGSKDTDALACKSVVDEVLAPEKKCGASSQKDCSFNGVWDGSRGAGASTFYLSSYLFDRVSQAGLVDPEKPSGDTTPKKILAAAKKACSLSPEEVLQEFKGVEEKDAPYYCHDLSYAHSLLTVGYKLADSRKVTLVKQITYKGQNIEAAWPLGAALNSLSS